MTFRYRRAIFHQGPEALADRDDASCTRFLAVRHGWRVLARQQSRRTLYRHAELPALTDWLFK